MFENLRRKLAMMLMPKPPKRGKKSIRLADVMPLSYFGTPIPKTEWTADLAVREGLKRNPWVYACCVAYARALQTVPHKMQRRVGPREWEDMPDRHPAEVRFEKPNPFMSRGDLIERNIYDLFTSGNAVTTATDSETSRKPKTLELWPIAPDRVTPIPDSVDYIKAYKFGRYLPTYLGNNYYPIAGDPGNGNSERFEVPRNVVHIQFADPGNPYWGLSPLQVASRVIDIDIAAAVWNFSMLDNRAVAGGVFTTPEHLETEEHAELKALLKSEIGGSDNVYESLLLSHGMTWQETSRSPVDMDFSQSRDLNMEEICAVMKVPPPILGKSRNVTLANLQQFKRSFMEDSVIPLSGVLMAGYNRAWVWPRWGEDVRLAFDFKQHPALSTQRKELVADFKSLVSCGYTPNEASQYLGMGLPITEFGNHRFVPGNWMMFNQDGTPLLTDAALPAETGDDAVKRSVRRVEALMSQLVEMGEQ